MPLRRHKSHTANTLQEASSQEILLFLFSNHFLIWSQLLSYFYVLIFISGSVLKPLQCFSPLLVSVAAALRCTLSDNGMLQLLLHVWVCPAGCISVGFLSHFATVTIFTANSLYDTIKTEGDNENVMRSLIFFIWFRIDIFYSVSMLLSWADQSEWSAAFAVSFSCQHVKRACVWTRVAWSRWLGLKWLTWSQFADLRLD